MRILRAESLGPGVKNLAAGQESHSDTHRRRGSGVATAYRNTGHGSSAGRALSRRLDGAPVRTDRLTPTRAIAVLVMPETKKGSEGDH